MADYQKIDDRSSSFDDAERKTLIAEDEDIQRPARRLIISKFQIALLCVSNLTVLLITFALSLNTFSRRPPQDPSIQIYSPASSAVEYFEKHLDAAFFTPTAYMGFPTDETDEMWDSLSKYGISVITPEEAAQLHTPTLPIPGTDRYLIMLDVFHQLHCLNDLRKLLYPERYPNNSLVAMTRSDGTLDRNNNMFRHWDHCIDAIRQVIMCTSDISPISFHLNAPVNTGVYPRLATTHTCRDFEKIQGWARERNPGIFKYKVSPEEAEAIAEAAGFDQSPEEDIEWMWQGFPGNLFFKHWRDKVAEEAAGEGYSESET